MSKEQLEILQRAIKREKAARKVAEEILEHKSRELYNLSEALKKANFRLEEHLNEKTSQLKGVFDNINDAYIVMDIQGNILKMNDIAEDLFEYNLIEDSINVVELIYKDDYPYAMNSYQELIEKSRFTNYTARVITKNKKVKWVNINASIIFDKQKKPIAAQGIIRDITVQREKRLIIDTINEAAKSILGKDNIYEIAWEISSNIATYLSTKDCVIYLIDHKADSLEQIAAFGNKLKKEKEIHHTVILPMGKGIAGSVAKTGKSEIINNTSLDDRYLIDDEERFSEIAVPIISEGNVIGIIDAEHKNKNYFTQEHLKTIENIASLVAVQLKSAINIRERKNAEVKNIELLKKVEKSNAELEEYAHIVSHDLKSPLRSINALVSWIKLDNQGKLDEITEQNLGLIESTLETMEQLISNVLEYSSAGAKINNEVEVNLNSLLENIKKILFFPDNISINILKTFPIIKGDATKFQQLFQNLISNAIKFSDKEKGIIEIDFIEKTSFYQFSVKDNGVGIEKKFHDKIFKIFQSLTKREDSSGIGLSIVKKIVELYEGTVWLESTPKIGTTFYFTIKK